MPGLTETVLSEVQLHYLAPLKIYVTVKPYSLAIGTCSLPRTNIQTKAYENVQISNIRDQLPKFSLGTSGFEYLKHETKCTFDSKRAIETDYVNEMAEVLKNKLNAQTVYIFDYTMRKARKAGQPADSEDKAVRQPSAIVHIDQTALSASKRVRMHLPDQAQDLLQTRFQILNIWRPLRTSIYNDALCVCDSRTIQPEDLEEADYIFPHYHGEKILLRHSNSHRWYYLKDQAPDEVALLNIFDSGGGSGIGCAHTSFKDPTADPSAPPRESIELRCPVFY